MKANISTYVTSTLYLLTPMDSATLLNAKSTISTTDYCLSQWPTKFNYQATNVGR